MKWLRTRENAAFLQGRMFGIAIGEKAERERIAELQEGRIILKQESFTKLLDYWREEGATMEQQRIIELLEKWFADGDNYQEPTSKLIALIKGEK